MSLSELLPALSELPRGEKLRVIQLLAAEVAQEEAEDEATFLREYPVWSPSDAFEGAATLMRVLEEEPAQ